MSSLDLTVEITPDEATKQAIETGLDAYNLSKAPDATCSLCGLLREMKMEPFRRD